MERVKRVMGCWPMVVTTDSPPGDQSAGGTVSGSSDRLRDAVALHEVRVMKIYRPQLFLESRCDPSSDRSRSFTWGGWSGWSRLRHHGEGHFSGTGLNREY